MKIYDLQNTIGQLNRLNDLITKKATGSPKELASKLGMSERSVYRLIESLKELGLPINYNRYRKTYQYDCNAEINVKLEISVNNTKSIKGGFCSDFPLLPTTGIASVYIYDIN